MTNPLATETIMGLSIDDTYRVVETTLPNGKTFKQLFQKVRLPDGTEDWQLVDEKIKAFNERFGDTTTIPNNWKAPGTEVLTAKDRETVQTIQAGGMTRIDMRRQLILGLGDPDIIIQAKGLDTSQIRFFKLHPSTLTLLHMMAVHHGDIIETKPDGRKVKHLWATVASLISSPFPDSLPS
ncbi:conserved hypothetical protein [Azospirillaceae bacterium]